MSDSFSWPKGPDGEELFDDLSSVASSMECTGLVPSAPISTSELNAYGEIYDIPLQKNSKEANHHMQNHSANKSIPQGRAKKRKHS